MKAVMVMYDTLCRHFLPPYGCDWVKAPNFARLAERAVTFDTSYIGSNPTIPTRRELHTGRYNFLHRGWGPLEPFDDSMPNLLKDAGVYSHLASDGYHYWEDGASTYHLRYSSWEFFRGQEGDVWQPYLGSEGLPEEAKSARYRQELINRKYMPREEDQPQSKTFAAGLEFLNRNHAEDNWFLQIETFDPHEPYYTQQHYKDLYPHDYDGPLYDWPGYGEFDKDEKALEHIRCEYAALMSMCDANLGKVLDAMDKYDLWKDTMLIVNTDHGFHLGEHGFTGKCTMPFYDEVARIPLFIWDPRSGAKGERRQALVQTIDLAPTLYEYFGVDIPGDVQGVPLKETTASDAPVREAALFGAHGAHVNCVDGEHIYMRAPASPENQPLFNYTLMPMHMRTRFPVDELQEIELAGPFSFTKGCKVMKIKSGAFQRIKANKYGTLLFDMKADPKQEDPIRNEAAEKKMINHMTRLMKENDCPPEQFERLGL